MNRAIGRKMPIGAVRRAREPGCKFDYVVVLEGAQGSGKSTALRILPRYAGFSDVEILSADQGKQQKLIVGVWICELSELAGLQPKAWSRGHFSSKDRTLLVDEFTFRAVSVRGLTAATRASLPVAANNTVDARPPALSTALICRDLLLKKGRADAPAQAISPVPNASNKPER